MRKIPLLLAFSVAILIPAFGQESAHGPAPAHKIDNAFVQQQFGDQFTMLPDVAPAFGDLDGDGVEDVVIAARCKNPMLDQGEHNYTVIDPYYDYFGYGDPKLTTTFSEGDPARRGLAMLIIHGAGPNAWRSATPKAKFVIVNLPYRTLSVRKFKLRKKTIEAVYVEEAGDLGDSSALFFDGKKFRYVPMGGDMQ
ncbi:MAG: hypothetical protein WCA13_08395 [Terriglobales bacterium]